MVEIVNRGKKRGHHGKRIHSLAAGRAVYVDCRPLRGYARRAEESVHELADKATEVVDQALDKGREFIQEKKSVLTEAVEAGRTVMHRERER